jgi:hypothetical protein
MLEIVFQLVNIPCYSKIISRQIESKKSLTEENLSEIDTLDITLKLNQDIIVELYTSISGKTKYNYPGFTLGYIPIDQPNSKQRLVVVEGRDQNNNDYSLVGFFEPIKNFNRNKGGIVIIKNQQIIDIKYPIADNSLKFHLEKVKNYFQGVGDNPYTIEQAITTVEMLEQLKEYLRKN